VVSVEAWNSPLRPAVQAVMTRRCSARTRPRASTSETAVEPQEGDQDAHTDESIEVLQRMADVDKPHSTMYAIQDGTRLRIKPLDGDWVTIWLKPGDLLVFRTDVCHHGMGYACENYRVHAYVYPPGYKRGPSSLHPCGQ
jgi:hypothetical protein